MKKWLGFIFIIQVISVGCATSQESACSQQDWYEIGRRDGVKGQREINVNEEFKQCSVTSKNKAVNLYANGRNAGLADYCHPKNALELGKLGRTYNYVCPADLEDEFLNNYERGRRIQQINNKNAKLKEEIERLKSKANGKQSLLEEINKHKRTLLENKSEIKKITRLVF